MPCVRRTASLPMSKSGTESDVFVADFCTQSVLSFSFHYYSKNLLIFCINFLTRRPTDVSDESSDRLPPSVSINGIDYTYL